LIASSGTADKDVVFADDELECPHKKDQATSGDVEAITLDNTQRPEETSKAHPEANTSSV
jgi:hypothetical protein